MKYCTNIKNILHLRIALTAGVDIPKGYLSCEGVISTKGMPVIKKNTSNTVKRITNEKNGTRKQEMCFSWAV